MRVKKWLFILTFMILGLLAMSWLDDRIFNVLANIWTIESDPIPAKVEAIISISYGAFKDRLTKGTRDHMDKVLVLSNQHPEALVGYSAFSYSVNPVFEEVEKRKILSGRRIVFAGSVSNTNAEAEGYHEKLLVKLGHEPETLVVVTGEFHGRSVRFVYGKVFPKSKIILVFTPWQGEIDPNDLQVLSRGKWSWLGANVARQIFIKWIPFGFEIYKELDIHQPT